MSSKQAATLSYLHDICEISVARFVKMDIDGKFVSGHVTGEVFHPLGGQIANQII